MYLFTALAILWRDYDNPLLRREMEECVRCKYFGVGLAQPNFFCLQKKNNILDDPAYYMMYLTA